MPTSSLHLFFTWLPNLLHPQVSKKAVVNRRKKHVAFCCQNIPALASLISNGRDPGFVPGVPHAAASAPTAQARACGGGTFRGKGTVNRPTRH